MAQTLDSERISPVSADKASKLRALVGSVEWKWLLPNRLRKWYRAIRPGVTPGQLEAISNRLHTRLNGLVLAGPFAGMRYIRKATGSALSPKLLGTYEVEIGGIVEAACRDKYDLLVDIGAAEGYYAVGMAFKKPDLRVVAFELGASGRELLKEMVELNQLENRIEIRAQCNGPELQTALASATRPLVICDVDGAEWELLDPAATSGLIRADILVELHDCFRAGVTDELRRRFAGTHQIEMVSTRPRHSWDCPAAMGLSKREAHLAVQEHRPAPQAWFWMRALNQK